MVRLSRNRLNMEDGRIDRAIFKDSGEFVVGGVPGIEIGGITYTLDCSLGNVWNIILAQSTTLSFSNPAPSGVSMTLTLHINQGGTGSKTITWPSSVIWTSGIAPVLSTGIGRVDVVRLQTTNGGSTWYGAVAATNFSVAGGELWGWGRNDSSNRGVLGVNDIISRSSPVQVGTTTDWRNFSKSDVHVVAIKVDNTLWAWGYNASGRLGLNDTAARSSPVQIGTLTNWAQCFTASTASAAVKTDGTLWTWGAGSRGRLGHNNATARSSPVQVGTLADWAAISLSRYHAAAIKTDGTLWTWGRNNYGQLGTNILSTIEVSSPVQVGTLTNWAKVSAGGRNTAVIKSDGSLWIWGKGTNYGLVGNNTAISVSSPVQVGSDTDWQSIHIRSNNAAAVRTNGTLWVWGSDSTTGQLGLNTNYISRSSPTQLGNGSDWSHCIVQTNTGYALKSNGTMWTWSSNYHGSFATNQAHLVARSSPVQIGTLNDWRSLQGYQGNIALR